MTDREEIAALQAELVRIAAERPAALVVATLDALIDVACGDNPALRDHKRKWIYVGILQKLSKAGVR